ncbi:transglutaminase superfamily protein [Streptomyces sp. TLI_235]|nr:transglutaminase domain-containing protein [Streptomyces sp. TLI_235]PBC75975.1 transglutaminase superfamily protein [Streptomyces sp. TLI_235]
MTTAPSPPAPAVPASAPPASVLLYVELALVTLAVATTALVYGDLFATRGHLVPLLATTAAGAVLAAAAALLRRRALWTVLFALGGFVVTAVFAVLTGTLRHGVPTGATLTALRDGVLGGWARMLTVGRPADVTGELLVTPALLLFAAVFVAVSVTLRTRSLLGPLAAPVLSLVVALLLTGDRKGGELPLTGVLLLLLLLQLLVRGARPDSPVAAIGESGGADPGTGTQAAAARALFGLPVVVAVALAGVLLAQAVPLATGRHRFDLRDVVPVPVRIEDTISPLATIKSQLQEKQPRELFTVRVDGAPASARPDRVRTAALDSYDGALWTSGDRFVTSGRTLAADPSLSATAQVRLHVSIRQWDQPYLPAAGWPEQLTALGIGFNSGSGVLAADAQTRRDLEYDVVGGIRPRDDAARLALPSLTADTRRYTVAPAELPAQLAQLAMDVTAGSAEPYAKLVALEKRLRESPYSLTARPGHSLDALRRLLASGQADAAGYSEQYAAAFAVLARSLGFPARVATGYLLRPEELQGDTYTVRSTDAYAWAEVDMSGYGWMAFDPSDPSRTVADRQDPKTQPPGGAKSGNPADVPGQTVRVDPNLAPVGGGRSVLDWTLLVLGALVALAILLPVAIAVAKWQRRRSLRGGPPARQVIGAWRNTTDQLVESGLWLPGSLTALEVAGVARSRLGEAAAPVAVLAPLVTEAVFNPAGPPPEAVAQAWRADAALRAALRRRRGLRARAASWFDPRPIVAARRRERRDRRMLKRLQGG